MKWEKEVLGFYLTTHPITNLLKRVSNRDFIIPSESVHYLNRDVQMVAYVEHVKEFTTKNRDLMATITISDDLTTMTAVIFPSNYKQMQALIKPNALFRLNGKINERNKLLQLIVLNVEIIQ
jgi:DNA polymerase-3 subunit alpha